MFLGLEAAKCQSLMIKEVSWGACTQHLHVRRETDAFCSQGTKPRLKQHGAFSALLFPETRRNPRSWELPCGAPAPTAAPHQFHGKGSRAPSVAGWKWKGFELWSPVPSRHIPDIIPTANSPASSGKGIGKPVVALMACGTSVPSHHNPGGPDPTTALHDF